MTRTNLRRHGVDPDEVQLVPGWFEQSLTPDTRAALDVDRVGIVMIDCDLESSARLALDFCAPLMARTVIFFDDWDFKDLATRGRGEAAAFEAWRSEHPEFEIEERPELRYSRWARAFMLTRKGPRTPNRWPGWR